MRVYPLARPRSVPSIAFFFLPPLPHSHDSQQPRTLEKENPARGPMQHVSGFSSVNLKSCENAYPGAHANSVKQAKDYLLEIANNPAILDR